MQASATIAKEREVRFDTDSSYIGVDNRCSACISHEAADFEVGTLKPCNRIVKGFGGSRVTDVQIGTLNWSWEDDNGISTSFRIPNSYYVPAGKVRLLSPQHWAQTQTATRRDRGKCGERTDGNECVLFWDDAGQRKRRIPLSRHNNVATFTLASGYNCFETFCDEAGILEPTDEIIALPTGLISDDDASVDEMEDDNGDDHSIKPTTNNSLSVNSIFKDTATAVEFDLNGPTTPASEGERTATPTSIVNVISDEEDRQPSDLAELLMLHHQYGHISMRKLQEMAKQGMIPRRLAKCRIPTCSACLYSKATKKPWRGKESKDGDGKKKPTHPGQVVSVDQLVSPTPGLIAQMTGFMTTKRYNYATVYVDQMTRFGYVYLQKTASAEETIESKRAFEALARRHGVRIEHYHADNGIFKANAWVEACRKDGQGMSYAGVNAHHQNGIAERRIRELQELARAMLIHANARWKGSITANLWPYAVRMASEAVNNTPSFQDPTKRTPIEMFREPRQRAIQNTGSRLGAQPTFSMMICRAGDHFTNGDRGQNQEFTLACLPCTIVMWLWY
jgi:hypothetical protein